MGSFPGGVPNDQEADPCRRNCIDGRIFLGLRFPHAPSCLDRFDGIPPEGADGKITTDHQEYVEVQENR